MNNLTQAIDIVDRIAKLKAVQIALKAAFVKDELDGGFKAAFTHPLWLQAQAEIDRLQDELKSLI
jgi:hypothetical protein